MHYLRMGNIAPPQYLQPPQVSSALPASALRAYLATLSVDASDIEPDSHDEQARLHQRATRLITTVSSVLESHTEFAIADGHSPKEIAAALRAAWFGSGDNAPGHASQPPSWISGTNAMHVELIRAELCAGHSLCEVRVFNQEVNGAPPVGREAL